MCGIVGCWTTKSQSEEQARAQLGQMARCLRHRGPDDDGFWLSPDRTLGLGHRRLSIVDLSTEGRQPMVSCSGRYTIAFNGEIYNFETLREELAAAGHEQEYRGHSDTEVALAAFEAWGVDGALARFIGMFAIALWDQVDGTLSLIRDRLGIKPLYYGAAGSKLVFGSEVKALTCLDDMSREVDRVALARYVETGYVPAPLGILSSVHKVEPGVVLRFSAASAEPDERREFWSATEAARLGMQSPLHMSERDTLDTLETALMDAVRLRMIADVPLGAFLSGGIDSSIVVALMQRCSTRPVRTFSIGNESSYYDESKDAEKVAQYLGCEHTSLVVSAQQAREVVPRLCDMYDEPFADSSQIPTYLVSELARKDVTVALSGDGGDEVFGGYNRHVWAPRVWRGLQHAPSGLRVALSNRLASVPQARWDRVADVTRLSSVIRRPGQQVHKLASVMGSRSLDELYLGLSRFWPGELVVGVGRDQGPPDLPGGDFDAAHRMMLLDTLTYLPGDILTKVDRASMAVSLEARVPLLDHRVVELAWRIPLGMKLRGATGKWVLRSLLKRYVPAQLVERPKMGFIVPVGEWLRGPLKGWAEDLLFGRQNELAGFFDLEPVTIRWREHLSEGRDWGHHLWIVLAFEQWRRRYAAGA